MKIFSTIPEVGPPEIINLIKFIKDDESSPSSLLQKILKKELASLKKKDYKDNLWEILFPEGLLQATESTIKSIQEKRTVQIKALNPNPIKDLSQEFLITSNVLLDIPIDCNRVTNKKLRVKLQQIKDNCKQNYWYDHPIPMDTPPEGNEILYGLKNLDNAIAFEKDRGIFPKNKKLTCVLSLSTTYKELAPLAKDYLKIELKKIGKLKNISIMAFSESDCRKIIQEILKPLNSKFNLPPNNFDFFGVDGEYGRHYSFLKSITAFIQICHNPKLKGSFKIDLDQVFDQEELIKQTKRSAFSHFLSPKWGALAIDQKGREKKLGMIAGALVNQNDASNSLFTPDVTMPQHFGTGETQFFCSQIPQAISTLAEMAQADQERIRIHVTGGTNGILIEDLKRYRPFTPSFVGRAEDQAYILSTFDGSSFPLAYLHKSGLIMRHDKEGFAAEAIEKAKVGKIVGDYQRILIYSAYANYLCTDITTIKEELFPFTSCFISQIPLLLAVLRLITKVQSLGDTNEAHELAQMGLERISQTLNFVTNEMKGFLDKEKKDYNNFFDLLENWNKSSMMKKEANAIIRKCSLS